MLKRSGFASLLVVALFALAAITCTLTGPVSQVTPTAGETEMRATLDNLQTTLSAEQQSSRATVEAWMTEVAPVTAVPGEQALPVTIETGTIKGSLRPPGDEQIPLRVVAYNIDSGEFYSVETGSQDEYTLVEVPVGQYHVLAFPLGDDAGQAGSYTVAVACGLGSECQDHSLMIVEVMAGQVTTGVDPVDWSTPPSVTLPQ